MFGSKNHTLSYWCVCCKSSLDLFIIHLRRQTSEFDMYQTISRVCPIHIGLTIIVLWNRLDVPARNVITLFFTNRNSHMLIRLPRIPKLLAPSSLLLLSSMVFSRTNSIRSFWKKATVHVQSDQSIWSHTIRILLDSSSHIVSALITDCSSKLNLPIRNNHTQILSQKPVSKVKRTIRRTITPDHSPEPTFDCDYVFSLSNITMPTTSGCFSSGVRDHYQHPLRRSTIGLLEVTFFHTL